MSDAANVLGNFFKLLVAVLVGGFSVVLEYAFFTSISPADKPWFPYLALSLTAGGFLGWLLAFRLIRHNPLHTIVALLMMIGCAATSLVVAGTEFYSWIAEHYAIATNPAMYQNVTTMLLIIFCGHVVALIVDVTCAHFAKNPFRGTIPPAPQGYYPPQVYGQYGNVIPMQPQPRTDAELLAEMRNNPVYAPWFNWMETQRGESARPLASTNQPKEAAVALDNSARIETPVQIERPQAIKQLPPMRTADDSFGLGDLFKSGLTSLLQKANNRNAKVKS